MAEDTKTEVVAVEEVAEVAEQKKETSVEKNARLQGKRGTSKKKMNRFSKKELDNEIARLKNNGHQASRYYLELIKHNNHRIAQTF